MLKHYPMHLCCGYVKSHFTFLGHLNVLCNKRLYYISKTYIITKIKFRQPYVQKNDDDDHAVALTFFVKGGGGMLWTGLGFSYSEISTLSHLQLRAI